MPKGYPGWRMSVEEASRRQKVCRMLKASRDADEFIPGKRGPRNGRIYDRDYRADRPVTPEQVLLEREQVAALGRLIDGIEPPRVGMAVRLFYGIGCEKRTLEELGEHYGVTRERARQIVLNGVRRLRYRCVRSPVFSDWRERHPELKAMPAPPPPVEVKRVEPPVLDDRDVQRDWAANREEVDRRYAESLYRHFGSNAFHIFGIPERHVNG